VRIPAWSTVRALHIPPGGASSSWNTLTFLFSRLTVKTASIFQKLFRTEMSNGGKQDFSSPKACADLKAKHDLCFYNWMRTKFLPGKATEDECVEVWQEYESCVTVRYFSCHSVPRRHRSHENDTSTSLALVYPSPNFSMDKNGLNTLSHIHIFMLSYRKNCPHWAWINGRRKLASLSWTSQPLNSPQTLHHPRKNRSECNGYQPIYRCTKFYHRHATPLVNTNENEFV
jgi:TRIAP1/MDM35 family protein